MRLANSTSARIVDSLRVHPWRLLTLLLVIALVATALASTKQTTQLVFTAAFFGLFAALSLAPAGYIGIEQTGEFSPFGRSEALGYGAAYDMSKLLEGRDQPDSRILLWTTLSGLPVIGWADLPHQGGAIINPETPPQALNTLDSYQLSYVRYPTTRGVLVMSQDPADMGRALAALKSAKIPAQVRKRGSLGRRPRSLRARLPGSQPMKLQLFIAAALVVMLAGCGYVDNNPHAVQVVAQSYLDALKRHDVAGVCRVFAPEVQAAIAAGATCEAALPAHLRKSYPRPPSGARARSRRPAREPALRRRRSRAAWGSDHGRALREHLASGRWRRPRQLERPQALGVLAHEAGDAAPVPERPAREEAAVGDGLVVVDHDRARGRTSAPSRPGARGRRGRCPRRRGGSPRRGRRAPRASRAGGRGRRRGTSPSAPARSGRSSRR